MPEYSKKIVDHFTHPRNAGEMERFDVKAFIGNPVCGDQIHLFARVEHERIVACSFLGYGCAASLATGSILTEEIKGRSFDELLKWEEADIVTMVGGFSPTQRHCATLGRDVVRKLVESYRSGAGEPSIH